MIMGGPVVHLLLWVERCEVGIGWLVSRRELSIECCVGGFRHRA